MYRELFYSSYVIYIQVKLHVLCRCMKHVVYVGYNMFVWIVDASMRDWKLYFINSHEGLIFILFIGSWIGWCCFLWIIIFTLWGPWVLFGKLDIHLWKGWLIVCSLRSTKKYWLVIKLSNGIILGLYWVVDHLI